MKKILIALLAIALIVGALLVLRGSPSAQVTGSASYTDQIDLPPGSTVDFVLIDVTEGNTETDPLAEQTVTTTGEGSPFSFALEYDPASINPDHDYSVGAHVRVNGSVWWTSTSNSLVITKGNPTESVVVKLVNVR